MVEFAIIDGDPGSKFMVVIPIWSWAMFEMAKEVHNQRSKSQCADRLVFSGVSVASDQWQVGGKNSDNFVIQGVYNYLSYLDSWKRHAQRISHMYCTHHTFPSSSYTPKQQIWCSTALSNRNKAFWQIMDNGSVTWLTLQASFTRFSDSL